MASSTLIGTAPDQVPTNGDLGDLAFQNKDSVEFYDGRGGLGHLELTALSKQINVSATDVFVYDTSKDSDGGAWRNRCQHTSWYNEPLNTTTRGARREFPSVAVIVATSSSITIYDGDDSSLPMWMVFTGGSAGLASTFMLQNGTSFCVAAMNAILVTGVTSTTDNWGSPIINFLSEKVVRMDPQGGEGGSWLGAGIATRNTSAGYLNQATAGGYVIVDSRINDVAMTVLPNSAIDAATGLPIPTIAVATTGGVSVIKDDGTVTSLSHSYGGSMRIGISNNILYATHNGPSSGQSLVAVDLKTLKRLNDGSAAPSHGIANTLNTNAREYGYGSSVNYQAPFRTVNFSNSPSACATDTGVAFGGGPLIQIEETPNLPEAALVNQISTKYNTGWMPGDIRGAWLNDTTAETVTQAEIVVDGNFESAANWTLIQASATATLSATAARNGSYGVLCTSTGGANVYSGREITGLTIGKSYVFKVDYNNLNHDTNITLNTGWANSGTTIVGGSISAASGWRTLVTSFIATTTSVWLNVFAQGTIYLDNLSVRTGELDRSINSKGLQVIGSIIKTPVAPGADLMAYGNFGSNYLYQPAGNLQFTGDICISFWMRVSTPGDRTILYLGSDTSASTPTYGINIWTYGGAIKAAVHGGVAWSDHGDTTTAADDWRHYCFIRRNGRLMCFINGVQKFSSGTAMTDGLGGTSYGLWIGAGYYAGGVETLLSLLRISATAPSDAQILKMYQDEKVLFQENAKATIYGTSEAITALAYDKDSNLLHVGTSSGRSTFEGIKRVSNTTVAVANSISAVNGLIAEN